LEVKAAARPATVEPFNLVSGSTSEPLSKSISLPHKKIEKAFGVAGLLGRSEATACGAFVAHEIRFQVTTRAARGSSVLKMSSSVVK